MSSTGYSFNEKKLKENRSNYETYELDLRTDNRRMCHHAGGMPGRLADRHNAG